MKLAISLFLSAAMITSTPKEDYMAFMGDFMKNTQLSFDFNITQNADGKTHVSKGYYKRSDKEFLLKNENYIVLSSKDISITVFESDKIIMLNEPTAANNLFVMDAASLKDAITTVTETPNTVQGIKQWNVSGKNWEGHATIKADFERKIPLQIALYNKNAKPGKDKPLMNISFSNISKAIPDKQLFSVSPYIQKKGNTWVLTQKYSKYELINNLD